MTVAEAAPRRYDTADVGVQWIVNPLVPVNLALLTANKAILEADIKLADDGTAGATNAP
jgi:hypothetical protein